jgi:hypothetical protein
MNSHAQHFAIRGTSLPATKLASGGRSSTPMCVLGSYVGEFVT